MFTLQNLSSTGNFYITQVNIPPPSDVYFKYVTMLLHGDGTNGSQNNTFIDSSTNAFTITRNGNTTQGTFTPYGANWSNYFGASTSNRINPPANAAFAFGTGAFTVEAWIFVYDLTAENFVFDTRSSASTAGVGFSIEPTTGKLRYSGSANNVLTTTAITANTWNHVAWVYNGTTLTGYINGVSGGTATPSFNITQNNGQIGNVPFSSVSTSAYLSNVRVVKGTAVYTANFTPSTIPLTAITNTSLLTCQNNRFIDNSANNFALTVSGSPSIQRFSPFSPSAAYSTSVIGGSGYFDGSGDYLNAPANAAFAFGTGDFTIEAWVNTTNYSGTNAILDTRTAGNEATGIIFYITAAGLISIYNSAALITASTALLQNTWNHIAVTRASGTATLWLNGVSVGSGSVGTNFTQQGGYIGAAYTGVNNLMVGYISNLRVVKGTAVYTGAFTPSTTPLTAITNTSLLLSYTNAGIYDNAEMNDLETVGTAQINTSVAKFGAGSMYFDGSSYLTGKSSTNFSFTGDFTIECWVYLTTASGTKTIFTNRSSYANLTGLAWATQSGSAALSIYTNSGFSAASSTAITTNTWTHVALTRSGSTITQWLNGVSVANVTNSSSFTDALCYIGANNSAAEYWPGYIDDFRITNGIARYSNTFTVPTTVFPDIGP